MSDDATQEEERTPPKCPIPATHRRLEEAHHFWHECLQHYDDPPKFRASLNALIQALRNITFILQTEKAALPNFDKWYEPWRSRMAADPVMIWVRESRNRVVKQGDLELKSRASIRLLASYYDMPVRTIKVPPRSTLEDYAKRLRGEGLPRQFYEDGNVCVERTWIDKGLPNRELLDACAHAFGVLSDLVHDGHAQVGIRYGTVMKTSWGVLEVPELQHAGGRLPCMVATEEERTTCYRVVDGTLTHGALRFHVDYDEEAAAKAARRYGRDRLDEMPSISSILDLAPLIMDNAKAILRKDRNHGWFVFFYKETTRVHEETLYARDQADKYILARRLADVVRATEADGVISVGDMWFAPFAVDAAGFPIRPAQSSERQEALIVHVETSDGQARELITPYTRSFRRIRFEETMEFSDPNAREYTLLEPIRKVWQTWQAPSPKEDESEERAGTDSDTDS